LFADNDNTVSSSVSKLLLKIYDNSNNNEVYAYIKNVSTINDSSCTSSPGCSITFNNLNPVLGV